MRNRLALLTLVSAALTNVPIWAQSDPEGSHVRLYFPQLADGGNYAQSWRTSFIFYNPDATRTATVDLWIISDEGRPMGLDLGSGTQSYHRVNVKPRGTAELGSQVKSSTVLTGWAIGESNLPVQGTVVFRAIELGVPKVDLTAPAALPTQIYRSIANKDLGIAIVNPYGATSQTVSLRAFDSAGEQRATAQLEIPPSGHQSFTLGTVMPVLPTAFNGSIEIRSAEPSNAFVAWTLNAKDGVLSTLPSGALKWPVSSWDAVYLAFKKCYQSATLTFKGLGVDISSPPVELQIINDGEINAFASGGNRVAVSRALAELLSDAPGELAFVVAHELAHIGQQRAGKMFYELSNRELDADVVGTIIAVGSGFDPYAGAGALAKLAMVTNQASLVNQIFYAEFVDEHRSFNTRIANVYDALKQACSLPNMVESCAEYRKLIHPSFPPGIPLGGPAAILGTGTQGPASPISRLGSGFR